MQKVTLIFSLLVLELCSASITLNTWRFPEAGQKAWDLIKDGQSSIDALVAGCAVCEELQCGTTVGYGGSPDEDGETTLDAMIFDGKTMDVGAVGGLRRVKDAIAVARFVLDHTEHSLLVGDQATAFAVKMGFTEEDLTTDVSTTMWNNWRKNTCQPNNWRNVEPDPTQSCGPYTPLTENNIFYRHAFREDIFVNHDTIGMITLDNENNIAAGTSTNGLRYKIPGRVGDSPLPGSGAYADNDIGAACATGNGDIMMRFSPSFLAVEEMRRGKSPLEAARIAVARMAEKYPDFSGAVIAANVAGEYGAACNGMSEFPFVVGKEGSAVISVEVVTDCTNALGL